MSTTTLPLPCVREILSRPTEADSLIHLSRGGCRKLASPGILRSERADIAKPQRLPVPSGMAYRNPFLTYRSPFFFEFRPGNGA